MTPAGIVSQTAESEFSCGKCPKYHLPLSLIIFSVYSTVILWLLHRGFPLTSTTLAMLCNMSSAEKHDPLTEDMYVWEVLMLHNLCLLEEFLPIRKS